MCSHQASEQLIGYLYQLRYALFLLLEQDLSSYQICIEKFDDVSFDEDGTPRQRIQLKHHIGSQGSLSNASVDLWRTLKVWMDTVSDNDSLIEDTSFLLITTAKAPENSAAYNLCDSPNRDSQKAYDALKEVAIGQGNMTNKAAYDLFLTISEEKLLNLLDKVIVIDQSANIRDTEKEIRKRIKYTCISKYEDSIFERLEGWWFGASIRALLSDTPVFINQSQARERIYKYAQEYYENNLPIDDDILFMEGIDESTLPKKERVFLEQLKIVNASDKRLRIALKDYYRAFQQRSRWIRDDLIYINDLDKYERRLIDAWEESFESMRELIENEGIEDEEEIAKEGRNLYSKIMDKEIHIRELCREPFVMKGSYHILANSLKVGWHIDFINRLSHLLSEESL